MKTAVCCCFNRKHSTIRCSLKSDQCESTPLWYSLGKNKVQKLSKGSIVAKVLHRIAMYCSGFPVTIATTCGIFIIVSALRCSRDCVCVFFLDSSDIWESSQNNIIFKEVPVQWAQSILYNLLFPNYHTVNMYCRQIVNENVWQARRMSACSWKCVKAEQYVRTDRRYCLLKCVKF